VKTQGGKRRRGAAAVEMAVIAPVLVVLLFGIIEFGWMFAVRNSMLNAAREGARLGALQGYTSSDVYGRVQEMLTPMGLNDKVTINIQEPTESNPVITVSLTVPQTDVSLVSNLFDLNGNVRATASMRKEGM
jgi:Flp pilus assembly protein TadG